ncbi:ribonuclease-like [Pseudonaja textilis]|nr:ribonuclease-like [Pseudonaja textilis]
MVLPSHKRPNCKIFWHFRIFGKLVFFLSLCLHPPLQRRKNSSQRKPCLLFPCKATEKNQKGERPSLRVLGVVDTMPRMLAYSVLVLFVALLLGSLPTLSQRETRHGKFHRQHVAANSGLDARLYCNLMMQQRGMTNVKCKPSNTFIHGEATAVDAICNNGGIYSSDNYYNSISAFELTVCRLTGGGTTPPNCNYRGRFSTQRVQVACVNGLPVHFKQAL